MEKMTVRVDDGTMQGREVVGFPVQQWTENYDTEDGGSTSESFVIIAVADPALRNDDGTFPVTFVGVSDPESQFRTDTTMVQDPTADWERRLNEAHAALVAEFDEKVRALQDRLDESEAKYVESRTEVVTDAASPLSGERDPAADAASRASSSESEGPAQ